MYRSEGDGMGWWLLFACRVPAPPPAAPIEPLPSSYHREMAQAALARVHDPARGGPPFTDAASPLPPFTGVDRAVASYVGSDRCQGCHPGPWQKWSESKHAHAMDALEQALASHNPDCFRCHVTGFGHPGGYQNSSSLMLRKVGCESCHGPASAHIQAPSPDYGALPGDGSACVACHTHDNAPEFRFDAYWPMIAH